MPRIKYFFALLYPQAIVTKLIQDGGPLPVEGPRGVGAQIYKMSVGMHWVCICHAEAVHRATVPGTSHDI